MPKILCECDNVVKLHNIPCENELRIISDTEFDKFGDTIIWDELFDKMTMVVKCPECGRLYVYWNGFKNKPAIYKSEII